MSTKYRGKAATWQYGRRLMNYDGNTFAYDALGKRIKKNSITFTYDGKGRLIKQSNGLEFYYDDKGVMGFKYDGKNYLYRKDIQGNIIGIINSDGIQLVRYTYDAWGNHTVAGNSTLRGINPFRYRGYYYDTETGLYYLQTRYYDPEVGRFINMDSLDYADPETINGLNLYAYCNNNPVMNVDPTGHFVLTFSAILTLVGISAGVGALFGLGSAIVKDLENGELFDGDVTFRTYLGEFVGGAIAGAGIGLAVALGAGLGAAVAASEALTIGSFAISGIGAFAISAGVSAVSGGLGYVVRTAISDQEKFNWHDMLIETSMNALSGITSFIGGYVGGATGLKIPGAKLGIKKFLLFHGVSLLVGVYTAKIAWALAKYALKKER